MLVLVLAELCQNETSLHVSVKSVCLSTIQILSFFYTFAKIENKVSKPAKANRINCLSAFCKVVKIPNSFLYKSPNSNKR
jgi:hypothetical protein